MRIRVELEPEKKVRIPFNYNHFLTSYIYSHIDKRLARVLHKFDGFKEFCFSNLIFSEKEIDKNCILTNKTLYWFVSSPNIKFITSLMKNMLRKPVLKINDVFLSISKVEILPRVTIKDGDEFATLSPIVSSTGIKMHDKLRNRFLSPTQILFYENLRKNALKKYELCHGEIPNDRYFEIKVTGPVERKLIKIKNGIVIGYNMHFRFHGNPKLMEVVYELGVGEKNSLGFGMVVKDERNT